jgi:hypothetical protein
MWSQNKKTFHVIGKGYTTGMSLFLLKVDDLYESYIDKSQGIQPARKKINEWVYKNQEGF